MQQPPPTSESVLTSGALNDPESTEKDSTSSALIVNVGINDLRLRGKEVLFIPVFINDANYGSETFLKLVQQLIYRFDKYAKNTSVVILICDALETFTVLFSRHDLFKVEEQDFADLSKIYDKVRGRVDSTTGQTYEQMAHNISCQAGQQWHKAKACEAAQKLLKSHFHDVLVLDWDTQKNIINAKYWNMRNNLQLRFNQDTRLATNFDITKSDYFGKYIKRGLPLLMQKPGVVQHTGFISDLLNRALIEQIMVFSSTIVDLQEKNADKNVVLIYPLPVSHRWHVAVMKLLKDYLSPNVLYRLLTPSINLNPVNQSQNNNKLLASSEKFIGIGSTKKHARKPSTQSPASLSPRTPDSLSPSGSQNVTPPSSPPKIIRQPGERASSPTFYRTSFVAGNPDNNIVPQPPTSPSPKFGTRAGSSPDHVTKASRKNIYEASDAPPSPPTNQNNLEVARGVEFAAQSVAPRATMFVDATVPKDREAELFSNAGSTIALLIQKGLVEPGEDEEELFIQFKAFQAGLKSGAPLTPEELPSEEEHVSDASLSIETRLNRGHSK